MSEPRTFAVQKPPLMEGADITAWQLTIRDTFKAWHIAYPVKVDGEYGIATRSATASLCHALGMTASDAMADGVTPELRTRIRNRRLNPWERIRMGKRVAYRRALRRRYSVGARVARPVAKIEQDAWGWSPASGPNAGKGHDGVDVICSKDATLYAMCECIVLRADTGGWWGKAPSGDVTKGDGVIVLEVRANVGPFKPGLRLVYGHAEHPCVHVGQIVQAGAPIGKAGLAVVPHIHLCVNGRDDAKGVGDRDPRPFLDYAVKNG